MNILVIGAGTSREFGYRRIRDLGHHIGVIDDLSFIPTALVDWYHPFAVSSAEAAVAAVDSSGERYDAVLCFSEWHLTTAVATAEKLGIPGPRLDVVRARQKDEMRAAFRASGMRTPRSVLVTDAHAELPELPALPVVVKPVDYSSSSGVKLVDDPVQVVPALEVALGKSFRGAALVEEFVAGDEFSAEGVVAEGKAIICGITRKDKTPPPYFVEVGHFYPAVVTDEERRLIEQETLRAVEAVGLVACAFHCEVKVSADGAVCIEIAGRIAGDHIPHLMYAAEGIDLYAAELSAVLGQDPRPFCRPTRQGSAAIRYLQASPGTRVTWPSASSVEGTALGSCLIDLGHEYPWYTPVPELDGSGRRLGHCMVAGTVEQVATAYSQAAALAPGGGR